MLVEPWSGLRWEWGGGKENGHPKQKGSHCTHRARHRAHRRRTGSTARLSCDAKLSLGSDSEVAEKASTIREGRRLKDRATAEAETRVRATSQAEKVLSQQRARVCRLTKGRSFNLGLHTVGKILSCSRNAEKCQDAIHPQWFSTSSKEKN